MSDAEVALRLAVVAVLAGYLYIKHRQRVRRREERYDPAEWTGKAIDVTDLIPRVNKVRQNHLAARQAPKGFYFHQALLDWARQTVARLAYFRDRKSAEQAQTRGPWLKG